MELTGGLDGSKLPVTRKGFAPQIARSSRNPFVLGGMITRLVSDTLRVLTVLTIPHI